jgi:glycosyltransferase involved in cell wall biosynthesis
VDLLHANWSLTGAIAGLAGRLTGTSVVTTLRGADVERLSTRRSHRLVLGICIALSNRVVTVNPALRKAVTEVFPDKAIKVSCIPNGVDDSLLEIPAPRPKQDVITLISVGSLIPRKNMQTVIAAFGQCRTACRLQLVIIGAGPERTLLGDKARRITAWNRKILFTGEIAPEEIGRQLATADIFILASHHEGRSNAVLEAMASALPVLVSDIPGNRDIVQHDDTGYLFEADDDVALAALIDRLADSVEARQRLGVAARRFITEAGLTWQACAGAYHALYRECLQTEQRTDY